MLTSDETIDLIRTEPEETYFYYDQPILFSVFYKGNHYMISFVEDNILKMTERFLVVQYSEMTKELVRQSLLTPREFFTYPDNQYTNVVVKYSENNPPIVEQFQTYNSPTAIPDCDIPMDEAEWNSHTKRNQPKLLRGRLEALFYGYGFKSRKFSHENEPSTYTAESLWLTWHRKNIEHEGKAANKIDIRVTFTASEVAFIVHSYGIRRKGCLTSSEKRKFILPEHSMSDMLPYIEMLPYINALQAKPVIGI